MPPGALWVLHYQDTEDDRVHARSDQVAFSQDPSVLNASLDDSTPSFCLRVQLDDNWTAPASDTLRAICHQRGAVPRYSVMQTFLPISPPDWVKPGQWIQKDGLFAQITGVEKSRITLLPWVGTVAREQQFEELPLEFITNGWTPCDPPREFPSRFDRILSDE